MQIQENYSLKHFNTFSIDAKAKLFAAFSSAEELSAILSEFHKEKLLVLGGGSNILLTKDFNGIVLKNSIKGIEVVHEDTDYVYLRGGAGENWHKFVMHCIDRDHAGLENLSLIPGEIGASPMQNIGAYGVEIRDVFWNLEAFHIKERRLRTFTENDCEFGYRESVFKNRYKNQYVILAVTFKLKKRPVFHTSYGAIREELDRMGVKDLSIRAISQAVINIRSSKLPDPAVLGNAGSFFKNPVVERQVYFKLKAKFPALVGFETVSGPVKLAAGWLIENSGPSRGKSWKGYRIGDAGVHEKQALVLVNHGSAKGKDLVQLADKIRDSVKSTFGVELEKEVNII